VSILLLLSARWSFTLLFRCFPHVINLAVQSIYAALKDGRGVPGCYGDNSNAIPEITRLPYGVTEDAYRHALKSDVLGSTRKLVSACRASGRRREEFVETAMKVSDDGEQNNDDGNPISRKALQLLRDCEIRWSSTYIMVDRVLLMLPVRFLMDLYLLYTNSLQSIKTFTRCLSMSSANLAIPNAAEVCLLQHIHAITMIPYAAQESLSTSSTPTLSYSLPLYHSVVAKWEDLKYDYPLLAPYIEVGIRKVAKYVDKSRLSRTYLLAVCKLYLFCDIGYVLTPLFPVLNPCLKMKWVENNCPTGTVQEMKTMALDAVSMCNGDGNDRLTRRR
jgi:hypothetical protein